MDILENFEAKQATKICLAALCNLNKMIFCDYPVSNSSNLDLIHQFLTKTHCQKMAGNCNSSITFLKKLLETDKPNYQQLIKRKKQFSGWHDFLTEQHMYYYSRNKPNWNNLGLCLHYLIDCHYHIYTRLLASPGKTKCFWCEQDISESWSQTLSEILCKKIPKIFLYQRAFHTETLNLDLDLIEDSLGDAHFLLQKTVK